MLMETGEKTEIQKHLESHHLSSLVPISSSRVKYSDWWKSKIMKGLELMWFEIQTYGEHQIVLPAQTYFFLILSYGKTNPEGKV